MKGVVAVLFAPRGLMHTRFGKEFNIHGTWSFKAAYNDKGGLQGGPLEAVKRELRTPPRPGDKLNHFMVELTDKHGDPLRDVPVAKMMRFVEAVTAAAEDLDYSCIISIYT